VTASIARAHSERVFVVAPIRFRFRIRRARLAVRLADRERNSRRERERRDVRHCLARSFVRREVE
jgi:hypothetical protein